MFIKCQNGHVPMHGRCVKKHGGRLFTMADTHIEDLIEEKASQGRLLSPYAANTVGGFTNGQKVLTPSDIAKRNINGSGFIKVPLMRTKQHNRNNLKFNI